MRGEYHALYCDSYSLYVETDNQNFYSQDNCIMEKANPTKLIVGSSQSVIPNYITHIFDHAFFYCEMESITIPVGVSTIGETAFGWCYNLSTIIFRGTMSQWNSVDKADNWIDGCPATKVVCSDGIVPIT